MNDERIPDEYCGPAMMALATDMMRRFAFYLGGGLMTGAEAARLAGYSNGGGEGAKRRAWMLQQRQDVMDAVREVSQKALVGLVPTTLRAAQEILEDKDHPQRARMVETVLDRTGYSAKTEQKIIVEHQHNIRELEEFARRLELEGGMAPGTLLPQGKVIDAEAVEIPTPEAD